jgi:hypothetical protein
MPSEQDFAAKASGKLEITKFTFFAFFSLWQVNKVHF